jgi:hypothetical protein
MKEYRVTARLTSCDNKQYCSEFHRGSGHGQIRIVPATLAHNLHGGWTPFLFDRIRQEADPKDKPARKGPEPDHENVTGRTTADNRVRDN